MSRLCPKLVFLLSLLGMSVLPLYASQRDAFVVCEHHIRAGEYAGDIDIVAQRVSPSGEIIWQEGDESLNVADTTRFERHPHAIPDGTGGLIVVFEIEARTGEHIGDSEIAGQRIDASGKLLWNDGDSSTLIAHSDWDETNPLAIPDGQGGAIILFERHSSSGEHAGDIDIAAQRISASGLLLWKEGDASIPVSSGSALEYDLHAIPDGAGGAIVAFQLETRTGEYAGDSEIFAQRIDADGNLLWNNGESVNVASSIWSEADPILVPDGRGGAIVVFEQHGRAGEYEGDIDVGAQRISATGEVLWGEGDLPADVASASSLERNPSAISDGRGGAIVVFDVEPRAGEYAGDSEIAAQRINPDGEMMWNGDDGYLLVSFSKWAERNPVLVSDAQGGAIVIFESQARTGEHAGDTDILAQRISPLGDLLWDEGESSLTVSSSPPTERAVVAVPDGAGGALVVLESEARTGEHAGDSDVLAQRIDANGEMMWNSGERSTPVAYTTAGEKGPIVVMP